MTINSYGFSDLYAARNNPDVVYQSGQEYKNDKELISATINYKEANQYILDNFNAFDKNGDGSLTPTEVSQRLNALGISNKVKDWDGKIISNNYHEQLYDKYMTPADLDNSGGVTAQELENKIQSDALIKKTLEDGVRRGFADTVLKDFSAVNTNNDLFISEKEFVAAGQTKSDFEELRQIMDIDNNNKISIGENLYKLNGQEDINLQEFSDSYGENAAKTMKQYDLNNDGNVTQDEIKAHDKEMSKEMSKDKGLSTGAIVGIIIGAIVVVGLAVALIVYLTKNKKKNQEASAEKKNEDKTKKENEGNSFDEEKKDIRYDISKNLNSVNQSQGRTM